jgi:hypothetical protein
MLKLLCMEQRRTETYSDHIYERATWPGTECTDVLLKCTLVDWSVVLGMVALLSNHSHTNAGRTEAALLLFREGGPTRFVRWSSDSITRVMADL